MPGVLMYPLPSCLMDPSVMNDTRPGALCVVFDVHTRLSRCRQLARLRVSGHNNAVRGPIAPVFNGE